MGLGRLEISLENEAGVFYAGNELRGVVRIEINGSSKRIRGTVHGMFKPILGFDHSLLGKTSTG